MKKSQLKFNCIDLFCGAGGMSAGFVRANFNIVFAVECVSQYAKTYSINFPSTNVYLGDIKKISNNEILKIGKKHKIDIIIGGPPCQGFSLAGNIGRKFLKDERNKLFLEYVRFVKLIQPSMFVLENVAALLKHNKGKTIKEIEKKFSEIGYQIQYKVLNSAHYNVPQIRRRIFIVGCKNNYLFDFPNESKRTITIKEAIDDLPILKSGQTSKVPNHNAMNHSAQMLNKMKFVKDGGNRNDIPRKIRPKSGDMRKYIRYDSSKPAPCVTGDMRKIFHYMLIPCFFICTIIFFNIF